MSPQIDMANSATGMETALFSLLSSSDAFYDRTPWFNPIGRGSQPLFHLIPSVQEQETVSFQHRVRIISGHGELKVRNTCVFDTRALFLGSKFAKREIS